MKLWQKNCGTAVYMFSLYYTLIEAIRYKWSQIKVIVISQIIGVNFCSIFEKTK